MPAKRKPSPATKRKPKGRARNGVRMPDHIDFATLVAEQGVKPIDDPRELMGDFWPDNESVDEFLAARKRWQEVPGRKR